jgi:hypothetical protein
MHRGTELPEFVFAQGGSMRGAAAATLVPGLGGRIAGGPVELVAHLRPYDVSTNYYIHTAISSAALISLR